MTNILSLRHRGIWLGLAFCVSCFAGSSQGQSANPTPPSAPASEAQPRDASKFSAGLALASEPDLQKKLDAARDLINEEMWGEATRVLQSLLDRPEDAFVSVLRKEPGAKAAIAWTSARGEANRLLGSLPAKGREFYELSFGPAAGHLLEEARKRSNPQRLAEVARRFLHTKAGAEALTLLATHHLDRGRNVLAAGCFERLLGRPDAETLPALTQFKAALALHRAGEKEKAAAAWNRLVLAAPDGVRLGNQVVRLAELRQKLGDPGRSAFTPDTPEEWPLFRGSASRSATVAAFRPGLEPRWQQATVQENATRSWLDQGLKQQESRSQTPMPGSYPIIANGRVVCRTHRGILALDSANGKVLWESMSRWGLDHLVMESSSYAHVQQWANSHLSANPQVFSENSLLGSLSTDGAHVYLVEDLPVPPHVSNYSGFLSRSGIGLRLSFAPELTDAVYHSRLLAVDLRSGKAVWEQGGRASPDQGPKAEPLADAWFLAPPLPLEGKLYALVEQNQELRLACLEPGRGEVAWLQTLGLVRKNLLLDPVRRVQAAHLAYADGMLLCPSNAGGLIAFDLLSRSLAWAHSYRVEAAPPEPEFMLRGRIRVPIRSTLPQGPPSLAAEWQASAPIVYRGKVIHAPADAGTIQCLSLRDGSLLWKTNRGATDLYLGGVSDDRILIVGKQECRALSLADGRELWKLETGQPAGLGLLTGSQYCLPLRSAGPGKEPALWTLDVTKGQVVARAASPRQEVPGNLLFCQGQLLSQTATGLTAFMSSPTP